MRIKSAEAFIFENTGKIVKTHSGVRSEFARLTKDHANLHGSLRTFLGSAYVYKEISDYGATGVGQVTTDDASAAIATAERFIACIVAMIRDAE